MRNFNLKSKFILLLLVRLLLLRYSSSRLCLLSPIRFPSLPPPRLVFFFVSLLLKLPSLKRDLSSAAVVRLLRSLSSPRCCSSPSLSSKQSGKAKPLKKPKSDEKDYDETNGSTMLNPSH
ncbi:hypothetical protein RIF29_35157 [Crotalaria pallida]|uniref:Uncharacterized protein n=1 Tax=Crotalaria pallida TaxID=3830 RepID=A0AAN9EBX5_CROPI